MFAKKNEPNSTSQGSRRSFLNILLGGGLATFISMVIYPVWRFLIPPKDTGEATPTSLIAGTIDELKPNSGKIIRFGRQPNRSEQSSRE